MDVQVKHLVGEMQQIAYDTFPKNIRLRTNVPNDLWTVQGDPTQLHQVLLNLCMNSRDAMPTGGVLSLDAENVVLDADCPWLGKDAGVKPGSYILIEVADSGPGMAPEMIDRIFDPFFTTKEVGKGTGLGLSTSLAILKSHGGTFRVDGGLGHGAKFSVYLPAQAGLISAEAPEKHAELPCGNGELILVVDDDAGRRQVTQQTLEEFGYNVLVAFDGAEAVAIYARQSALIDAVITDVMMPVMDGPASIAVLRKMNPEVRIIAASGQASGDHRALLASLGVNHYLSKPYTAEALLKALASVLADGAERMKDET
jgi:CheY-like chemotaxis protein